MNFRTIKVGDLLVSEKGLPPHIVLSIDLVGDKAVKINFFGNGRIVEGVIALPFEDVDVVDGIPMVSIRIYDHTGWNIIDDA